MTTPNHRLILTDLVTALGQISVANGYHTDVATVALTAREWYTCRQAGPLPWIGIMPTQRRNSYIYHEEMRSVMEVGIQAHLNAYTDLTAYDYAANVIDDIIKAVHADPTRGGYAIDTRCVSDWDDSGDPDRQSGQGTLSATVNLEIIFERSTTGS